MKIRLQQRDFAILRLPGRYGVIDSKALESRCFETGSRVARRRLAKLVAAGLLKRFSVGEYFYSNGRQPYVYALTEHGAEVLVEDDVMDKPRVVGDVSAQFVAHTLQVSQFLLQLDESAAAAGVQAPAWWFEYDATDSFQADPNPKTPYQQRYILHETFEPPKSRPNAKPFSYRPDAAFFLTYKGHALLGYLEVDRSTEPLRVFGRKLPAFARMVGEERFRNHWPSLNGQSVTVRCYVTTKSRRRLRSIAQYAVARGGASPLRLASLNDLDRNLLLDRIWSTVDAPDEKGAVINA
jgi:hypothetical protein